LPLDEEGNQRNCGFKFLQHDRIHFSILIFFGKNAGSNLLPALIDGLRMN